MSLQRVASFGMLCCGLWLAGCSPNQSAEIDLFPKGEKMQRKVRIVRPVVETDEKGNQVAIDPDDPDVMKLRREYGDCKIDEEGSLLAKQIFDDEIPPHHVDGAAHHQCLVSPLGEYHWYAERFGPAADVDKAIQRTRRRTIRDLHWMRDWVCGQLTEEKAIDAVKKWFEERAKPDVLHVLHWFASARLVDGYLDGHWKEQGMADNQNAMGMVMTSWFVQRGHLRPAEVPRLFRSMTNGDGETLFQIISTSIRRQVDPQNQFSELEADVFSDVEKMAESFREFMLQTPEYQKALAKFRRENPGTKVDKEVQSSLIADLLDVNGFLALLFDSGSPVTVRLHLEQPPLYSNGVWDPKRSQLVWAGRNESADVSHHFRAIWCQRTEESARWDAVRGGPLTDDELQSHNLWYAGLSLEKQKQWDAVLQSLPAEKDIVAAIEQSKVLDETAADQGILQLFSHHVRGKDSARNP
ncbi:MAG: hypothetical protein AAFP90_06185 [Planctomycetota bacterium]